LTSQDLSQAVIFIAMFVLVSGPVHECAHAFVAWKLGDGTAKLLGRVSLDPIRHFDPVGGTLLIVSVMIGALSHNAIGFGWAKPTPVNPYNLRGRYADTMVAVAGPLSNLVLAALFAVGFRIMWARGVFPDNTSLENMIQLVFWTGVRLNVLLMLFNLLPIPPLDGSHVLLDMLDARTAERVRVFFGQYGMLLLLLVVFLGWRLIGPLMNPIVSLLIGLPVG
jgi:Zn-dependent proteases